MYIYIFKENLAKLHKRTINYIPEKKKENNNNCSGEVTRREHTNLVHPKTTTDT